MVTYMPPSFSSALFPNQFKIIAAMLTILINFSMSSIIFLQTNSATMNGVASNVYSMDATLNNQFVIMNSNSTPAFEIIITTLNLTTTTFGFANSTTRITTANASTYVRTT